MNVKNIERRKYKRLFFSIENLVDCIFTFSEQQKTIMKAKVLNLSAGGVCISIERKKRQELKKGDNLILEEIPSFAPLDFVSSIDLTVKYVIENKKFKNIYIGCEFSSISISMRNRIQEFVDSRL